MMTLKELMIVRIQNESWIDYCYIRGDNQAKTYPVYKDWLNSLSDEDFIDTYDRVKRCLADL